MIVYPLEETMTLILDDELQAKILRRAERAFTLFDAGEIIEGSDDPEHHVTRCHKVTADSLSYRIPHSVAGTPGPYSGPQVVVRRSRKRSWLPPWSLKTEIIVPGTVEDNKPSE
jgi:hypothetical protein